METEKIYETLKVREETITALKSQLKSMEHRLRLREEENRFMLSQLKEDIKRGIVLKKSEMELRYREKLARLEYETKELRDNLSSLNGSLEKEKARLAEFLARAAEKEEALAQEIAQKKEQLFALAQKKDDELHETRVRLGRQILSLEDRLQKEQDRLLEMLEKNKEKESAEREIERAQWKSLLNKKEIECERLIREYNNIKDMSVKEFRNEKKRLETRINMIREEMREEKERHIRELVDKEEKYKQEKKVIAFRRAVYRRARKIVLVPLVVSVIIFIVYKVIDMRGYVVGQFPVPFSDPSALLWDGSRIWSADWFVKAVVKHNMDDILSSEKVYYLDIRPNAMVWIDGILWTADASAGKIFMHTAGADMSPSREHPAPGAAISGLAWDGKEIWSCDRGERKIYRHYPDVDLTVEAEYSSPGTNPSGLCWDGKNLWSIDSGENRIYRHVMDAALSVDLEADLKDITGGDVTGLAFDGKAFWIISSDTNRLYRCPGKIFTHKKI